MVAAVDTGGILLMKLFLVYLLGMFMFGLLSRRRQKTKFAIILGVCLLVCCGYYFLNQI
jgi:hypothetical protein